MPIFDLAYVPVLLADVPGEVVAGAAPIAGLAITALWRRLITVEDRSRADKVEAVVAIRDAAQALQELMRLMRALQEREAQPARRDNR